MNKQIIASYLFAFIFMLMPAQAFADQQQLNPSHQPNKTITIYFAHDSSQINPHAMQQLDKLAQHHLENRDKYPSPTLEIVGHTSSVGSREYNFAIGETMAESVRSYLISQHVPAHDLSSVSFGEKSQICEENTKKCHQQNRRVNVIFSY